jgi:hypothetical protein
VCCEYPGLAEAASNSICLAIHRTELTDDFISCYIEINRLETREKSTCFSLGVICISKMVHGSDSMR